MDEIEHSDFLVDKHVALRRSGRLFYVPDLFPLAPTYNVVVPLLIRDIMEGCFLKSLYGRYYWRAKNCLLVNNYPINQASICGRILGQDSRTFTSRSGVQNTVAFFTLDDSSGEASVIKVRVPLELFESSALKLGNSYGVRVKVIGYISSSRYEKLFYGHRIEKLDTSDGLAIDLNNWTTTLAFRREVLSNPWVCDPSSVDASLPERKIDYEYVAACEDIPSSQNLTQEGLDSEWSTDAKNPESISVVTDDPVDYSSHTCNSSIHVVSVNSEPDFFIAEFQLTLSFINWMMRNNFKPFKLSELYHDGTISYLLDSLIRLKKDTDNEVLDDQSYNTMKYGIFHTIRHNLQIVHKLIRVTKTQYVTCDNLKFIYDHLKCCIELIKKEKVFAQSTKILDVRTYIERMSVNNIFNSNLDYKLINGIIDHIIINSLNEKHSWKYDKHTVQWSYIG